jgi:hypothetical protein
MKGIMDKHIRPPGQTVRHATKFMVSTFYIPFSLLPRHIAFDSNQYKGALVRD